MGLAPVSRVAPPGHQVGDGVCKVTGPFGGPVAEPSAEALKDLHRRMVRIRLFEEEAGRLLKKLEYRASSTSTLGKRRSLPESALRFGTAIRSVPPTGVMGTLSLWEATSIG